MAYDYNSAITRNANLYAGNQAVSEGNAKQEYLQELRRQRAAMKKQERDQKNGWWKRMLGNAVGGGLGLAGMALGGGSPLGMAAGGLIGSTIGGGLSEFMGGSPQAGNAGAQWGMMAAQNQMNSQLPYGSGSGGANSYLDAEMNNAYGPGNWKTY